MHSRSLRIFLPRSNSKLIFIIAMSCYAIALTTIETRLIQLLRAWPTADKSIKQAVSPVGPGIDQFTLVDVLLLSPVGESLIMIAVMEGVRRIRLSTGVQVVSATCVICLTHSVRYTLWGFVVAPAFLIDAGTFVYWRRRESIWVGAWMMIVLHICFNAVAAVGVITNRLHGG
jgi:hypothetical protein